MELKERKTLARFKKQCMVALLAAGMLLGAANGAKAIDFKVAGEWLVGFGVGDSSLIDTVRNDSGKHKADTDDIFAGRPAHPPPVGRRGLGKPVRHGIF